MYRWAIKRQPWKSLLVDGNRPSWWMPNRWCPRVRTRHPRTRLEPDEIRELRDIFSGSLQRYETARDRRVRRSPFPAASRSWLSGSASVTGCRIGELLQARWEDVDLKARTWFVPAANTKTRVDWQVYISRASRCGSSRNCTGSPPVSPTRGAFLLVNAMATFDLKTVIQAGR
jgi:integrase